MPYACRRRVVAFLGGGAARSGACYSEVVYLFIVVMLFPLVRLVVDVPSTYVVLAIAVGKRLQIAVLFKFEQVVAH